MCYIYILLGALFDGTREIAFKSPMHFRSHYIYIATRRAAAYIYTHTQYRLPGKMGSSNDEVWANKRASANTKIFALNFRARVCLPRYLRGPSSISAPKWRVLPVYCSGCVCGA